MSYSLKIISIFKETPKDLHPKVFSAGEGLYLLEVMLFSITVMDSSPLEL